MSKGKVTDFFSTRKRSRFNQDDILLNKQKKTQTVMDPTDVIAMEKSKLIQAVENEIKTRSRAKVAPKNEQAAEQALPVPSETDKKVTRSSARKKQMEELKQKMNRLDDKLSKIKEVQPGPELKQPEAADQPAKPKAKKKVNMAELKAKLKSFNDNLIIAQENVENTKPAEPETTPSTTTVSAFVKYKDLASKDIDIKCTLTLPSSYSKLLDAFKGSDSIIKFLNNRQETCTFLKLKLGIQNITKHTFTLKSLSQLKTVYPLAYIYKQEKMFIDFKNDYHLTIAPNLDDVEEVNEKGLKQFSPNTLLTRLNHFKTNLFVIVKNLHQQFLESIGIANVDFKDIKRWHPKFDLESVPQIEQAELPKSPNESIKVKTGQDLLNIAKDVYSTRIKEAIKEHVGKDTPSDLQITDQPKVLNKVTENVPAVVKTTNEKVPVVTKPKTVDEQVISDLKDKKEKNYSSLLEKIRNKEKTKAFESMVINSDKEKNLKKYGLYKDTIRFLLFFFQSEKKSTIEFEKINTKLADNLKAKCTENESRDLLVELMNDKMLYGESGLKWITSIKVRNISYLKMDKSFQLNDLWAKCDKLIAEL